MLVRVSCIQNTQIRGKTIAKGFGKVDTFWTYHPPSCCPVHRLRVSRRRPRVHLGHRVSRCRPQCTSRVSAHAVLQCTSNASGKAVPQYYLEGEKAE
jgi:hypothetical protein